MRDNQVPCELLRAKDVMRVIGCCSTKAYKMIAENRPPIQVDYY